jgi:hypothetical protein
MMKGSFSRLFLLQGEHAGRRFSGSSVPPNALGVM